VIEILGLNEGKEFEAALHLRKKILAPWPDLSQSETDHVKIFVGLKLYGYRIEDIDLVVLGSFGTARPFDVEYSFHPRDGDAFVPLHASVKNFALVIETKSHDASGVKFEDKLAAVRYRRGDIFVWEPVTEKNRQQMFEFKRYLADRGVEKLYVQDLIFFSGLKERDLPKRPHNCFGVDASFERILNILGQVSGPRRSGRNASVVFGTEDVFNAVLSPDFPLLQKLKPTPIDRRKMDRIVKDALPDSWLDDLGRKQVAIRGRGGVGKTVILLQMAYRAFDTQQMRSLVLTYNKALVADMRRTMALLGVPRNVENGGICIETVHAFIGQLMHELGIIQNYDGFLEAYEDRKELLLTYIRGQAVAKSDLEDLARRNPDDFLWDLVFVDEGQDWPRNEIEILRSFYGPERIVVTDGVDQFVRSSVADWSIGLARSQFKPRRLNRCLRMKANLTLFVTDFAELLGLADWDMEPNPDANGGRVVVIEGDMARRVDIYDELQAEAAKLGNYPVDLLACVPPTFVVHEGSEVSSLPGQAIVSNGGKVWDASALDVREHFPTDREALRIVQYDSCRGLEGWTVINYGLDEFWEYKRRQWVSSPSEPGGLFGTQEQLAEVFASRWVMIPLTRAIDTLVINVSGSSSRVKQALHDLHGRRSDFVEWVEL
jgi:hypothetical protein